MSDDLHLMQTRINDMLARVEVLAPPPERIYLTDEQIAACPRVTSPSPSDALFHFTSIPVDRVETVEESTPFKLQVEKLEREGYKVLAVGGKYYAVNGSLR